MQTQKQININPLFYKWAFNRETEHMVMLSRITSTKTPQGGANIRLAIYKIE